MDVALLCMAPSGHGLVGGENSKKFLPRDTSAVGDTEDILRVRKLQINIDLIPKGIVMCQKESLALKSC